MGPSETGSYHANSHFHTAVASVKYALTCSFINCCDFHSFSLLRHYFMKDITTVQSIPDSSKLSEFSLKLH